MSTRNIVATSLLLATGLSAPGCKPRRDASEIKAIGVQLKGGVIGVIDQDGNGNVVARRCSQEAINTLLDEEDRAKAENQPAPHPSARAGAKIFCNDPWPDASGKPYQPVRLETYKALVQTATGYRQPVKHKNLTALYEKLARLSSPEDAVDTGQDIPLGEDAMKPETGDAPTLNSGVVIGSNLDLETAEKDMAVLTGKLKENLEGLKRLAQEKAGRAMNDASFRPEVKAEVAKQLATLESKIDIELKDITGSFSYYVVMALIAPDQVGELAIPSTYYTDLVNPEGKDNGTGKLYKLAMMPFNQIANGIGTPEAVEAVSSVSSSKGPVTLDAAVAQCGSVGGMLAVGEVETAAQLGKLPPNISDDTAVWVRDGFIVRTSELKAVRLPRDPKAPVTFDPQVPVEVRGSRITVANRELQESVLLTTPEGGIVPDKAPTTALALCKGKGGGKLSAAEVKAAIVAQWKALDDKVANIRKGSEALPQTMIGAKKEYTAKDFSGRVFEYAAGSNEFWFLAHNVALPGCPQGALNALIVYYPGNTKGAEAKDCGVVRIDGTKMVIDNIVPLVAPSSRFNAETKKWVAEKDFPPEWKEGPIYPRWKFDIVSPYLLKSAVFYYETKLRGDQGLPNNSGNQ